MKVAYFFMNIRFPGYNHNEAFKYMGQAYSKSNQTRATYSFVIWFISILYFCSIRLRPVSRISTHYKPMHPIDCRSSTLLFEVLEWSVTAKAVSIWLHLQYVAVYAVSHILLCVRYGQ